MLIKISSYRIYQVLAGAAIDENVQLLYVVPYIIIFKKFILKTANIIWTFLSDTFIVYKQNFFFTFYTINTERITPMLSEVEYLLYWNTGYYLILFFFLLLNIISTSSNLYNEQNDKIHHLLISLIKPLLMKIVKNT